MCIKEKRDSMKTLAIIGLFVFIIANVLIMVHGVSKYGEDWYNL